MTTNKPKSTLKLIIYLTLFLVFVEFWAQLLHSVRPLPGHGIVDFSSKIIYSWPVIQGMLHYIFAQIAIYAVFIYGIWLLTFFNNQLFKLNPKYYRRLAIALWFTAVTAIFTANQIYYPWSIFAFATTPTSTTLYKTILMITLFILTLAALLALIGLCKFVLSHFNKWHYGIAAGFTIGIMGTIGFSYYPHKQNVLSSSKPNIIIIGIDSLRPDRTALLNKNNPQSLTPNIDQFLQHATLFTHAYTPLARTFAAWMSILTGKDPKLNGARYSLPNLDTLKLKNTLARKLKQAGYETIFASDDRRFNHITKRFGFNQIIAPKTGFNDFIFGNFNDFPFSNLLINTQLGSWLFPYSYSNRSAAVTYEPKTFINYLKRRLQHAHKRPIFLAIHLTLPHYPLVWANAPAPQLLDENNAQEYRDYYAYAVARVDRQFHALIQLLKVNQLLEHAFVTVISDHGQALGVKGERVTSPKTYSPGKVKLSKSVFKQLTQPTFGHGTDLLNRKQDRIVFAMLAFGSHTTLTPGKLTMPVSLIDIKPTILQLLNLPMRSSIQGISLLPYMTSRAPMPAPARNLFLETGFTLPSLLIAHPQIKTVLEQGLSYFAIKPSTGAIIIKPLVGKLIIEGKQRAVIHYPWLVAVYPLSNDQSIIIVANLITHQWTTDLHSALARSAHARQLLSALEQFYGGEVPKNYTNSD